MPDECEIIELSVCVVCVCSYVRGVLGKRRFWGFMFHEVCCAKSSYFYAFLHASYVVSHTETILYKANDTRMMVGECWPQSVYG